MKLTAAREDILAPLQSVIGVVERRQTMPVLANVLLSARENRLNITGTYSHVTSDTLSNNVFSNNRTEIFYSQLQYRLRQLNVLAGYTRFSQGISAAGTPPGAENSYFIGVSRWINFF